MFNKKNDYVIKTGITGEGQDYNIYIMNRNEKVAAYLLGFAAGFLGAQIMFENIWASVIIGVLIGFFTQPIVNSFLFNRRKKTILLQFRDLMDSMSNSFSAGKNTPDAFADAQHDMQLSYGNDAIITKEVTIILNGLHSNFTIEVLLKDLAERTGIQDIKSFADTFSVCNRLGGNLKKIVADTRDIIGNKIEIEMEIQTIVTSNKNEMNIMCIMPFVIVLSMHLVGTAVSANTPANIMSKLFALVLLAVSYAVGKRITDIKV